MQNNTDVPFLFTSLLITKIQERSWNKPHTSFMNLETLPTPITSEMTARYNVAIQAKINGDPKYETQPLIAGFDVSVRNMEKMMNSFQQIMLFYLTPVLAAIAGSIIYMGHKREGKRTNKK